MVLILGHFQKISVKNQLLMLKLEVITRRICLSVNSFLQLVVISFIVITLVGDLEGDTLKSYQMQVKVRGQRVKLDNRVQFHTCANINYQFFVSFSLFSNSVFLLQVDYNKSRKDVNNFIIRNCTIQMSFWINKNYPVKAHN